MHARSLARPRKVIAKSDEDRTRLEAIFKSSFLFRHLTTSSMNELIDAMFVKDFSEGDVIITQGDKGDFFYVIELPQLQPRLPAHCPVRAKRQSRQTRRLL